LSLTDQLLDLLFIRFLPGANMATETLHPEDLLIGILAALSLRGRNTLKTTDKIFHSAFGKALEVFKGSDDERLAGLAESYYPDVVSKTYGELNHALITAEGYSLLRYPNPSYTRLPITMTPAVAEQLLERQHDQREVFDRAAIVLLKHMARATG
jgi:hypothetical protein